jgi:hypothetical protein
MLRGLVPAGQLCWLCADAREMPRALAQMSQMPSLIRSAARETNPRRDCGIDRRFQRITTENYGR